MLILASASPRRQDALRALGLDFQVEVSHAEESLPPQPDPGDPVPIAQAKAADIATHHPDAVVLAGDTIVTVDGLALGKPGVPDVAEEMLRTLRGRRHAVRTGLALIAASGQKTGEVAAPLTMRQYSDDEIAGYVATGEPLECAGAYDIHRRGGRLIASVEGCFSAIVGLPIVAAAGLLEDTGITAPRDPAAVCRRLYGRPCLAENPATASACRLIGIRDES